MDTEAWNAITGVCSCVDHARRPHASSEADDPFGALHVLLFGDMKQTAAWLNVCMLLFAYPDILQRAPCEPVY